MEIYTVNNSNKIKQLKNTISRLNSIGIRLSTKSDSDELLTFILTQCMQITNSDGGSIYIRKTINGKDFLEFSYTKNISKDFPFNKFMLPLDKQSLAGYSGYTGEICNFESMEMTKKIGLTHNKQFDEKNNYKTCNMLVVPMKDFSGKVIGVMQLINKKINYDEILDSDYKFKNLTIPYTVDEENLISSLTSQCAILLERNTLLNNIRKLFKSFIESLVTSLDHRDPITAGHSFRVAEISVYLAMKVNESDKEYFRDIKISKNDIRLIYYSGLLHDIGKIGVKESVLLKRNRLIDESIESIKHRFNILRYNILYDIEQFSEVELNNIIETIKIVEPSKYLADTEVNKLSADDFLHKNICEIIKTLMDNIEEINQSGFLTEDKEQFLNKISKIKFIDNCNHKTPIINEYEFKNLSVKRGNLTSDERLQIENHAKNTFDVLKNISWTDDLMHLPLISSSHHEKLNGTGYPKGMLDKEIPFFSKILAIADIWDALTASDRPYKPAIPIPKALSIMKDEARQNHIDSLLLNLFEEQKVYEEYNKIDYSNIY